MNTIGVMRWRVPRGRSEPADPAPLAPHARAVDDVATVLVAVLLMLKVGNWR